MNQDGIAAVDLDVFPPMLGDIEPCGVLHLLPKPIPSERSGTLRESDKGSSAGQVTSSAAHRIIYLYPSAPERNSL